jgi:tetratricopeptide (TPR) repeat protein
MNSDPLPQPANAARTAGRRWGLLGLLAVVGLASAGLGVYAWRQRGPDAPPIPAVDLDRADPEVAEVISNARAAVVSKPRSAQAWGELGMALHANSHYPEAGRAYEVASWLAPGDATWVYLHGVTLHLGEADTEKALPYLRRAAELSDRYPARDRLGELLLELGRLDEAEAAFRQALATDASEARARFGLAQVALARGELREALGHLHAVGDSPYARKRACALRAGIYGKLGDQQAVRVEQRRLDGLETDETWPDEALERAFTLQAGLDARLQKATNLEKQGQLREAVTLLEATTERYAGSDAAWSKLGLVRLKARDFDGADKAVRKSLELAPRKAENWLMMASLEVNRRRYKDAEQAFRKAIELTPDNVIAHVGLAASLSGQGDRKGAAAAYREALKLRPNDEDVRQRLAELEGER